MNPISEKENLNREIGVRSLSLAIINITIGTGIFVIPALIAESLGAAAILAYLVCGFLIFLIALCFAEVGSKTSVSGGLYEYIESAFGPYAGFMSSNLYWLGASVISDGAVANALVDTLKSFFPLLTNEIYRVLFFILIFGGLALLNIRNVKNGVRFVEFTAFGKLLPLVLLVLVGSYFVSPQNLNWTIEPTVSSIGSASLLLFFAFMGLETPLCNGGEIKNPKKTVPLGLFFGISGVLILYIGIQVVTQGVLGETIAEHKDAPLAAVSAIVFGKIGVTLIVITTAISMLGCLGGELLSVPRVLFASARDGLFPKFLAQIHPRFLTPHTAILFYASFGLLFSIFGGFKQLAILASASSLINYLAVMLATLKLRKNDTSTSENSFRVPGGILVPILAAIAIVWLLSNLTKEELISFIVFISIFSILFLFLKKLKKIS
ncbi:APC family permease [Flavobacterium sp.]|uniref:APC family permease n=1 Tax=Flavobacterium sp. TaxID=239 RepID=UPI0037539BDF